MSFAKCKELAAKLFNRKTEQISLFIKIEDHKYSLFIFDNISKVKLLICKARDSEKDVIFDFIKMSNKILLKKAKS